MNLQERRNFQKQAQKKGLDPKVLQAIIKAQKMDNQDFANGEKCRLRVDELLNDRPNDRLNQGFRAFVESYRDKIVTVEYDNGRTTPPVRQVCIAEDETEPKFLIYTGHLEKVNEGE